MTTVNSVTAFPTTTGPATAAGRTTETPAHGSAVTVQVIPLWAAPWSPAAQGAAKH
ncbi:hypothetical protein ACFWP2_34000 [Kitasatospora sp. NPDC058444]|uniref:hypothetical protein n=1 Tax=Kitasatospora sp. NPDC058444 TaxID=3346504 RepID=UPI003648E165